MPMTVGELIEHLKQLDPSNMVMLECTDEYYSSQLEKEALGQGHALLLGPCDWVHPTDQRVMHYPGGWLLDDGLSKREFTERRPCLVIRVGG